MSTASTYRKGFGLGRNIAPQLARDYHSSLVRWFREHDHMLCQDGTTVLLAREFGFCYGVDRAVEYAYETRQQFPDRTIHITGEIIHNPHVNSNLRKMDINFLSAPDSLEIDFSAVGPGDVVILPAFGARSEDLELLRARGAVIVDTTCASVLNVSRVLRIHTGTILPSGPLRAIASFGTAEGHGLSVGTPRRGGTRKYMDARLRPFLAAGLHADPPNDRIRRSACR